MESSTFDALASLPSAESTQSPRVVAIHRSRVFGSSATSNTSVYFLRSFEAFSLSVSSALFSRSKISLNSFGSFAPREMS